MAVNNKRIVYNTVAQYARTIVSAVVALLSTRYVLSSLGVSDYGIYALVAGVISMFGFLSNSLVVAIQRFLACAIADNDVAIESRVYSASQVILFFIGGCILLILMFSASCIVSHLNIVEDRRIDALYVFYLVAVNFVLTVVSVPQQAALIAYEKIVSLCIIGIIESLLKLLLAISLLFVTKSHLCFYVVGLSIITLFIRFSYTLVLRRCLPFLRFTFFVPATELRHIMQFAGVNLFGGVANLARNQGVNVLLNLFFGTVLNASYSLANQINSQLLFFSTSIFQSSNSQIMQCVRRGNYSRLGSLVTSVTRWAFSIYFLITMPIFSFSKIIIETWLGEMPPYTDDFVRLMLLCSYIELFSVPIMYIIQANGKINSYFSIVSALIISSLPVSYFLLKTGFAPYSVYFGILIVDLLLLVYRLWFVKNVIGTKLCIRFIKMIVRCFLVCAIGLFLSTTLAFFFDKEIGEILLSILCSLFLVVPINVVVLCNKEERCKILAYVRNNVSI